MGTLGKQAPQLLIYVLFTFCGLFCCCCFGFVVIGFCGGGGGGELSFVA